jgi:3-oxoacyl-[acyl-carrier-protein] synthase-3
MAVTSVSNCEIAGLAAAVPRGVAATEDSPVLSSAEAEKLIRVTGIQRKRVAEEHVCTSDLCVAAAEELINVLGWQKQEIGLLIFVSQTPDYLIPATASILQDRLGLPKHCMAFDIILGCSGYVYGMSVAASIISAMGIEKGILLAGDTMSKIVNPGDRGAGPLFGDAGTATALRFRAGVDAMTFDLCTDGSGWEAIMIPDGGGRRPFTQESLREKECPGGGVRKGTEVHMNGPDVFAFTLREVPPSVRRVMHAARVSVEDVDAFVFHQANRMMNESIRKKLEMPTEKFPYSLDEFGNTSSATIPLTLTVRCRSLLQDSSAVLVLAGFGVGLSWGSMLVRTDHIVCPQLVEV